jgi:RNA polymerase sigma factor (sigma-70 family)
MTSNPDDDGALLTAWSAARDDDAIRRLCDRHAALVAAACRRLGSPDADEATQAVFLILARRAGSLTSTGLAGWLHGTARRVVAHQRRAAARRRRHEQEAAVDIERQQSAAAPEPLWADARQHLDEALASLSAGRREALLRFHLQGKSQAEVAAELGCSVDAVKTRVHEGVEGLRTFFARRGLALGSTAVAAGLASECAAAEPTLATVCAQSVLVPASVPGAAALATGVTTAMLLKSTALIATGVILVSSCLSAALVMSAEPPPPGACTRAASRRRRGSGSVGQRRPRLVAGVRLPARGRRRGLETGRRPRQPVARSCR